MNRDAQADKTNQRAVFSVPLPNGSIAEAVFRREKKETAFVFIEDGTCKDVPFLDTADGRVRPYSPGNNLLTHGVVLLPSGADEYGDTDTLLAAIRGYVHDFVDLTPAFEEIAAHYVLMSWIYDGFNELPYLRVRGHPGCGKTRFLMTVGSICYKPIFASGASTVSPVFRILDAVQGTLIMDESDFRASDERAEVVKILNNGNARGFPVLRSELTSRHEFEPRAYLVFGPKIVATRGFFEDRALESRFLTEDLGRTRMRRDIPISLPQEAGERAANLRNRLLMFRLRNYGPRSIAKGDVLTEVEPRLNQVFGPLLSLVRDEHVRGHIVTVVKRLNAQHINDRGMEAEAQVLEVATDLMAKSGRPVSLSDIAKTFTHRFAIQGGVTPRWVGYILRRKLFLRTHKSHGTFVLPTTEGAALRELCERYGINSAPEALPATEFSPAPSP